MEYVLLEAEVLQRAHEYKQALKLYKKILKEKLPKKDVSEDIWMNLGVLCHELRLVDDSLEYFQNAAQKLKNSNKSELIENFTLTEEINRKMFCDEEKTWLHCTLAFNVARVSFQISGISFLTICFLICTIYIAKRFMK